MKEEYFWSIVIEQELVQVGIWTIRNEKVAILKISEPTNWESDEDLVEKVDAALSEVVTELPEGAHEPSKTVFGVPASWVEDGKIKKAHLEKIRLVSQKLSLLPTGFVVLPEAIAHGVKVREGSPLSGVILGVGVGSLDLTLFRLGNIVGTVSVGRSVSLIEDIIEGLSRFPSIDNIPTRWLLYDGREVSLEEIKQELIKSDWKETAPDLKILHAPQIEIVTSTQKAEAVSIAGASEISVINGIEGEDRDTEENVAHTTDLTPEDLGFVVDHDVKTSPFDREAKTAEQKHSLKPLGIFSGLFKFLPKPKLKMPRVGSPRRLKFILPVVLVFAVVGLVILWLYVPKASIAIYISPKNLQDSKVIVLSDKATSPDIENFVFPASLIEVEVTSEKTQSATGAKTVGDKAKGKVTIRNGTAEDISLDSGTKVTGPNSLEFVLDEGVDVSAASSPSSPGTTSVNVTAGDIGGDYNLAKDETFSVSNYPKSDVDAVADDAFSGGTSREITAISQDDIDSVKEKVTEELKSQAVDRLRTEAGSSRFVTESVRYEVVDESPSGKVGDEAGDVSYSITMKATGLILPEEQVDQLSATILKDQIPSGFSLKSEQVKTEFGLIDEVADGEWEFDVSLSANLLPTVDVDAITKEVAGKSPESVKDYLSKIPGYSKAVVSVNPSLPGFLGSIPRITKNISIEILAEK